MLRWLFPFVAPALLAGCDNVEDSIKEEGPKARAVVTEMAAIARDLETRPPVTESKPVAVPPGISLDTTGYARDTNALIVHYEDLQRAGELGNVEVRTKGSHHFSECASFLDHRTYPWNPKEPTKWLESLTAWTVADRLKECGRAKLAVVVRTMAFATAGRARVQRRPAPLVIAPADGGAARDAGADASAKPKDGGVEAGAPTPPIDATSVDFATCSSPQHRCVYDPAYVKAEIHVFTLGPATHKGAFVLEVESGTMQVAGEPYATQYASELQSKWDTELLAALAKYVPLAKTVLQ